MVENRKTDKRFEEIEEIFSRLGARSFYHSYTGYSWYLFDRISNGRHLYCRYDFDRFSAEWFVDSIFFCLDFESILKFFPKEKAEMLILNMDLFA